MYRKEGRYVKRSNQQNLGEAIREFLKRYGLEDRLIHQEIYTNWDKVLGPTVARRTTSLRIKGDRLYVQLNSSVLRHELSMEKETIINRLNESVNRKVIREIVLM